MRINVNFTISVPAESLPALRELAVADTNQEAIMFVKGEAQDGLVTYLDNNGVRGIEIVRDSATTY